MKYNTISGAFKMNNDIPNAWLLAWNPSKYDWEHEEDEDSLDTMFKTVNGGGGYYTDWDCLSTKIKRGDLVYFIRPGKEPKGIFASGYVMTDSYKVDSKRYADVLITKAVDFRVNDILSQQILKKQIPDQEWSPQSSGISIKPEATKWLINNWNNCKEEKTEDEESELLGYSCDEAVREGDREPTQCLQRVTRRRQIG